jgi:hypothetical protein
MAILQTNAEIGETCPTELAIQIILLELHTLGL